MLYESVKKKCIHFLKCQKQNKATSSKLSQESKSILIIIKHHRNSTVTVNDVLLRPNYSEIKVVL